MDKLNVIIKWLADYLKDSGKSTFVICFNGSKEDGLLTHLCSEACKNTSKNVLVYSDFYTKDILGKIYNGTSKEVSVLLNSFIDASERAGDCDGIVVGPVEKSFGKYYRTYHKNNEGLADIFPIYDLNYSDVVNITCNLFGNDINWIYEWPSDRYQMVEWANSMEEKYEILTQNNNPSQHEKWKYFTQDQKSMIAFMHAREHKTRHKIIHKPYPILGV
jgi:hypothetical protein